MARSPRVVIPNAPHHVTQRGSRRLRVFSSDTEYRLYLRLLAEQCTKHGLEVWSYCLMPNHVHLVAVPGASSGLAAPIGEAHRAYAWRINRKHDWTGHLWQERFRSFPMDETHLFFAVRYVLLNPVRANLVQRAEEWPYSSARAHLMGRADPLVDREPMADRIDDWRAYLASGESDDLLKRLRRHSRTGRPLGNLSP